MLMGRMSCLLDILWKFTSVTFDSSDDYRLLLFVPCQILFLMDQNKEHSRAMTLAVNEELLRKILTKLDVLNTRLDVIDNRLDLIENRLSNIDQQLTIIRETGVNMESHIDMVNGVYGQVKEPFFAVMDYAGSFFNTNTTNALTDDQQQ